MKARRRRKGLARDKVEEKRREGIDSRRLKYGRMSR